MLKFEQITYQSPLYDKVVQLRERILRAPLGLTFSENDLSADKNEMLFALTDNGEPVACLQIKPLTKTQVKLRQMAVDTNRQRQNLGTKLVKEVEKILKEQHIKSIELHARESAIGFYQKLGYHVVSERFIEVGIPHFKMLKVVENL